MARLDFEKRLVPWETFGPRFFDDTPEQVVIYNNKELQLHFSLGYTGLKDKLMPFEFANLSRNLFKMGVLEDIDDLAKMIVKNRRPERKMAVA